MQNAEFSDLEEGEILELDLDSSKSSENEVQILESGNTINSRSEVWHQQNNLRKDDYVNENLRRKLKLPNKKLYLKSCDHEVNHMLDYFSSDNEYRSDDDRVYFYDERRTNLYERDKDKNKRIHSNTFNGSAEHIMCQIDEMVCRKSGSGSRRKYRELKCNKEKLYEKKNGSYGFKSEEPILYKSVLRSRKYMKRKFYSIESDFENTIRDELRKNWSCKKKKKRVEHQYKDSLDKKDSEIGGKNSFKQVRDFDEVRKHLLENLKKQEEQYKRVSDNCSKLNMEFSKGSTSQSEKILNDSVNYLNSGDSTVRNIEESSEVSHFEADGDDEMDLVQLRSIALASNKKHKNVENLENSSKSVKLLNNIEYSGSSEAKSERHNWVEEDSDLDRNELLLRAEALKTALLKKHVKRLNKLKGNKNNQEEDIKCIDAIESEDKLISEREKTKEILEVNNVNESASTLQENTLKNNIEVYEKEVNNEQLEGPNSENFTESQITQNNITILSCVNPKRKCTRNKIRKKRKKITSFSENVKENNDQSNQMVEEDCRSLRSQLLCDLIKKKSLKYMETKSVLMDSLQKSVNQTTTKNLNPILSYVKSSHNASKNIINSNNFPSTVLTHPKVPKPEIQRIIVHLGSDDSSEEDEDVPKKENYSVLPKGEIQPTVTCLNSPTVNNNNNNHNNNTNQSIQASYEKSVELLLSEARKKIESEMQKVKVNDHATPEAVYKHLPLSQRLEYLRLKQKIKERERLKKMENLSLKDLSLGSSKKSEMLSSKSVSKKPLVEGNEADVNRKCDHPPAAASDTGDASSVPKHEPRPADGSSKGEVTSTSSNSSNVASNNQEKQDSSVIAGRKFVSKSNSKTPVKKLLGYSRNTSAKAMSGNQSNASRIQPSQALLLKLKLLFKKIKIEKTIEKSYDKEISKLKTHLSALEKKKSEQQFKIKRLADESVKTYKVLQNLTHSVAKTVQESKKETGKTIKETNEELQCAQGSAKTEIVSVNVEEEPKNQITEGDTYTVMETEKEVNENNVGEMPSSCTGGGLIHYSSPLNAYVQGSDNSERVDPNVIMCQFDLLGVCRDEECTYQHLRTSKDQ